MTNKNNLPPARGFGFKSDNSNDDLRKCLICGMTLSDDMPRGLVIESGKVQGVECISCAEGDEDAIQLGTPKNPLIYDGNELK